MNINTENAANLFFSSPSLQSVYYETIANSLDANADKIWINISIGDFSDVSTFELDISDNGDGFNEKNFNRFSNLLEKEDESHKGIGRLVFLKYFKTVNIESYFERKKRTFAFDWDFSGSSKIVDADNKKLTTLLFREYIKTKIKEYSYLVPNEIKEDILEHFFPRFYRYKREKRKFEIIINLKTDSPNNEFGFSTSSAVLNIDTIPDLMEEPFDEGTVDLISKFTLLYSIEKTYEESSLITAICVDERTIPVPLFSKNSIPNGYKMVFLIYSDFFSGKTNTSRDSLDLDEDTIKTIKQMFRKKASLLINSQIPEIKERNEKLNIELEKKYPHLQGYFEGETIGLIEKEKTLEIAQKTFFKEQKAILDASSIDDIQYEKSLNVSSRLLAEYVLYRSIIINKLKKVDYTKDEGVIHNLIVPKKMIYQKNELFDNIFSNNAWLLDDKYMSYTTVLSDQRIKELYKSLEISEDENKEGDRPDITIIFSGDPSEAPKTDVVIVELKKLGLGLSRKEELISQLKQRGRVLLKNYPEKIQRIWFYGIVDFDLEFRISLLEDEFIELFSTGSMFYKEHSIILEEENMKKIPIGLFIQSYQAFLDDAECRNSTFLNLLRKGIKNDLEIRKV